MTIDVDTWVPIEGFPGYSVNPLGQVRRDDTGRLLRTRLNQYGVPYVGLMLQERKGPKRQCVRSLPRIVAKAFLPAPTNRRFDTPIQMDGNPNNCAADNIAWRPRWYAVHYKNQFEDRYDFPIKAPVRVAGEDEWFPNSFTAACNYGLLEREVVLSVLNHTLAWPTYQQFELVESD